MKNTSFKNPTGLTEEGHFSSAYDMAIMAKELLKYESITKLPVRMKTICAKIQIKSFG